MNRSVFLNRLLGAVSISTIPLEITKDFRKIYLLQCFVAGFRHYSGISLLETMKEGDLLELKREPSNEFDFCAIALFFKSQKIGYIPKEINTMLSTLLDADALSLFAVITHLEKTAKPWENLAVAIYFLQETNNNLPAHANYLTRIETPHYRTLKASKKATTLGIEALFQTKNRVIDLDKIPTSYFELKNELLFHFEKISKDVFSEGNYLKVDNDTIFSFIENIKEEITEIKANNGEIYLEFELV